jgi:hypothetical protein
MKSTQPPPENPRIISGENLYRILLGASGLAQSEAAELHGVSKNAVFGWVYNQAPVPPKRIAEMADAAREVMEYKKVLADEMATQLRAGKKVNIPRMFYANETARIHGWRFASMHWQAVRLAIAELPEDLQAGLIDRSAKKPKSQKDKMSKNNL